MLVVLLRGVNFGFWSHVGSSGQNAIVCRPYVAAKVSFSRLIKGQKSLDEAQSGLI